MNMEAVGQMLSNIISMPSGGATLVQRATDKQARRHLTIGEKADIALKALPLLEEEAKIRQEVTRFGSKSNEMRLSPTGDSHDRCASALAGKLVGIGQNTVLRARRVATEEPELYEKVRSGEIPVNTAPNPNPDDHMLALARAVKRFLADSDNSEETQACVEELVSCAIGVIANDGPALEALFEEDSCLNR